MGERSTPLCGEIISGDLTVQRAIHSRIPHTGPLLDIIKKKKEGTCPHPQGKRERGSYECRHHQSVDIVLFKHLASHENKLLFYEQRSRVGGEGDLQAAEHGDIPTASSQLVPLNAFRVCKL